MYNMPCFKENDRMKIFEFMDKYPLAFITAGDGQGKPVATQIPLVYEVRDEILFLQGHLMRNSDHHKAFEQNENVLAVFTGPNAYVSASWYSQPSVGSTWNYMSVQHHGRLRFLTDEALKSLMKKMTLQFEKGNALSPTIFDNLPQSYLDAMLPAIAGFEIRVDKSDSVFKLSQNKDMNSYVNIVSELEKQGGMEALLASEMKERKDTLF